MAQTVNEVPQVSKIDLGTSAFAEATVGNLCASRERRLAERVGFEPTVEFPLHTLSKRAPSTTRTSLRLESTICERFDTHYPTRRRLRSPFVDLVLYRVVRRLRERTFAEIV